jgi:hypothetical protein
MTGVAHAGIHELDVVLVPGQYGDRNFVLIGQITALNAMSSALPDMFRIENESIQITHWSP